MVQVDGQGRTSEPATGAEPGDWRKVTRSRAYELVIQRVEEHITAGALHVGDRLPPERELAAMLGVSRAAVREAMRALEAQGVVRAGVGVGPDGGTTLASMSSEAMTRFLRLHIALANFPVPDVIEARVMMERWSVRLAAQQGRDGDIDELGRIVDEMDATDDRERFNELDTAFHVGIARAGRNRLVADLTTSIRDSMKAVILAAFRATDRWEDTVADLRVQHRAVYDAIRARDGAAAADTVEGHIRFAYAALNWG